MGGRGIFALGRKALKTFVELNIDLSRREDVLFQEIADRRDGNYEYVTRVLPGLLKPKSRVLDVGAGKHPSIPLAVKARLELQVAALDISETELRDAPAGAYDRTIVGDVATEELRGEYDLITSCAVMEHVHDVRGAFRSLAGALAPGGVMAHFIPSAFAPYALMNRLLGNRRARELLFALYPDVEGSQGFVAYYHSCWPSRAATLVEELELELLLLQPYYQAGYASFFVPAHTLEIAHQLLVKTIGLRDLCESFTIVARKRVR